MWASMRSQTVSRTMVGALRYQQVLQACFVACGTRDRYLAEHREEVKGRESTEQCRCTRAHADVTWVLGRARLHVRVQGTHVHDGEFSVLRQRSEHTHAH